MQPIEIRAKAFLSWLAEVEIPVDGGAVLPKADLYKFRLHADDVWQAWFIVTWEMGEQMPEKMQSGFKAFEEAVYSDDLTGRMMLAQQCWEQQGNLPSFAVHYPWELAYEPSRLAAVRKALERMVATEEPPPARKEEPPATYPKSWFKQKTGLSSSSITNMMRNCGVALASRGDKAHRWTQAETEKVLRHIAENAQDDGVKNEAKQALLELSK